MYRLNLKVYILFFSFNFIRKNFTFFVKKRYNETFISDHFFMGDFPD